MGKGFLFDIRIEDSFKQEDGAISIQNGVFDVPLAALSKTAICMFWYLATKRAGDRFCVSKPDFMEKFPATSERQYYSAMQELIDVGYMKRDEETGFYNFNPNVEIKLLKKERKTTKKSMYPDIILPKDNENFLRQQIETPARRDLPDNAFYIIPLNSTKRGNIKNVYFCKGKLIDLSTNIDDIVNNEMGIQSANNHRVKEYAVTLILNRAIDYTSFPYDEKIQKAVYRLPMISQMREEGSTYLVNEEKISWSNAMVENNTLVRELFEKENIPLGAIVVEEE